jgi:hypothetical protein
MNEELANLKEDKCRYTNTSAKSADIGLNESSPFLPQMKKNAQSAKAKWNG